MELSIQKIKKEIESKRKHNEEVLKLLKERSIIYNAEKERQKKYFLNTSSSLLSRKRKHSSDNDDNNKNEEISNYISNYEDYDEYIDDFNSSFFSNRTFTNLNFCRPERFSFSKNKNKKKLLIKNEEGFTIDKTIIQRPMKRYSNCSLTFSHTSNDKENGKSKEIKSSIGLFGSSADKTNLNSNQEKNSFFDIKDSANSTLIQEKKSEIKSGNSLFGDSTSLKINNNSSDNINNNNNANTKSLFSSNITGENKNEEKKTSSLFGDKKDNKLEQSTSLFGDLNRFNKNEEPKPLFSAPAANIPATSDKSKDNEKSKGLFSSPIKETKNKLTDNKNETPKKISLFGIKENEKEKENKADKETEKEKEKISIPNSLFGFVNKENKETKDNKENKKNEEIIQLKKELLQTKEEVHNLKYELDMSMVEGTYYICSAMNQNKCFDIKQKNQFYYLIINDLNKNSQTQKFKVKKNNEINHCIMNYKGDRILDVYRGNYINGTKIIVFEDMHKGANQCWILVKCGIHFCIKSSGCFDKVIDIPNGNLNNGVELEIYHYNGGNNQLWKLVKA